MTTVTQKISSGYKQTEIGMIPTDWDIKELGQVCKYQNGTSLERYFNQRGGYKVISIGNYSINGKYIDSSSYISFDLKDCVNKFILNKDDLAMILNDKTSTGEIIGRVLLIEKSNSYVFNQRTMRLTSHFDISPMYLYFLINSSAVHKKLARQAKPGTQIYLNTADILYFKIGFPRNKAEQSAIAVALSDADALIEKLEKLIEKKKNIVQGVMQELFTAKRRLSGFSGEWKMKKIGGIGKTYGGLSGKVKGDFGTGNSSYIPFMNIMNNPIIDLTYFDTVNIHPGEFQNKAQKGDLFFNGSSETPEEVGMCSVLLTEIPNLYLNSFCFGFRLNQDLKTDGLFFSYYFRSDVGRALIFSLAQGATRYNLSKTNLLKLEVPYPKPEEQIAIATALSDMDIEIEKLESQLTKYQNIKQGMMQTLLSGRIRLLTK